MSPFKDAQTSSPSFKSIELSNDAMRFPHWPFSSTDYFPINEMSCEIWIEHVDEVIKYGCQKEKRHLPKWPNILSVLCKPINYVLVNWCSCTLSPSKVDLVSAIEEESMNK